MKAIINFNAEMHGTIPNFKMIAINDLPFGLSKKDCKNH